MAELACLILFLALAFVLAWGGPGLRIAGAVFCVAMAALVVAAMIAQRRDRPWRK